MLLILENVPGVVHEINQIERIIQHTKMGRII